MVEGYKVGLGIVTCDRLDYLSQSLNSVMDNCRDLDVLTVVNDGQHFSKGTTDKWMSKYLGRMAEFYISEHDQPYQNVATGKNDIIERLADRNCDYIFLMEDDMVIKSPDIFEAYIRASLDSGIMHMNFAKHGTANMLPDGVTPNPRQVVNYNNSRVGLYKNCVGSFSMYHKDVIDSIGYMDTKFHNAFEHVEHTYRAVEAGFHPPFWWFADLERSEDYITEIENSIENTTRKDVQEHVINGFHYFAQKHGTPVNRIENKTVSEVTEQLVDLRTYRKYT
jgi:glycosyltransferase involved in cell wall biosynthesis